MDTMDVDDRVNDPLYARLFARAPIYDLVFACLSPRTLVNVALICRAAYRAVVAFKNRAFNAKTNTLVSGSNALQFLDRTFYPKADLDLYTHPGHSLEVAQFLVEQEGYRYVPRESQEEDWKEEIGDDWDGTERRVEVPMGADHAYPNSSLHAVWSFEKTSRNGEKLTVQIVEAASSPVESILGFHSTCVMNFISADAAYSLYPVATFEDRRALGMVASHHSPAAVEKYVERGWRIYFFLTPTDQANPTKPPFMLDIVRWVADKHTWVLPLDQTGVKPRPPLSPTSVPLTCDPALFNGWQLAVVNKSAMNGYEAQYLPMQTTMFRYNYAIPEGRIQRQIRDWAWLQGKHSHGQVSKKNWVWFDADLPGFLNMLE